MKQSGYKTTRRGDNVYVTGLSREISVNVKERLPKVIGITQVPAKFIVPHKGNGNKPLESRKVVPQKDTKPATLQKKEERPGSKPRIP